MNIRLPYSKRKRYLTGMDWTIGALDFMTRRATGGSNASQLVLKLAGALDENRFRQDLSKFASLFPELVGRVARDWNLAPYWRTPRVGAPVPVRVETETLAPDGDMPALTRSVNAPFRGPREHLVFRLFKTKAGTCYLAMHFDHRLFDAQGAEAFLQLFHRWQTGEDCAGWLGAIARTEPAHLCDWQNKFDAGRQLVRRVRSLPPTPPTVLPRPAGLAGRTFRFRVMEFDEVSTAAITERAYRKAGFLMFMPYALASVMDVLDGTLRTKGAVGADYLVSVSIDTRTPATAAGKLFFNHVSFLLFHLPAALAGRRDESLIATRTQMYEQVKSGFPKALAESSMLMRILPLGVLSRLMTMPLHGEFATLGFSSVGKGGYPFARFMDVPVENLFHMPLVPVPPGFGVVFNQFGGKMNATLSYVDGMLTDGDVQQIDAGIRRLL